MNQILKTIKEGKLDVSDVCLSFFLATNQKMCSKDSEWHRLLVLYEYQT